MFTRQLEHINNDSETRMGFLSFCESNIFTRQLLEDKIEEQVFGV